MEPLSKIGPPSGPPRTDRDTPASEAERRREDARRHAEALADQTARDSQMWLDALPAGREKRMVIAIDQLLSFNLGNAEGYLGEIGLPATRRLQRILAEYGITPDYGAARGQGRRTLSRT